MEDFVTYDLALKLKDKGFREDCLAYYDVDDNVGLLYNTQYTDEILPCQYEDLLQCHNTGEAETQSDDSENCVDAPTISQVLKWLREEKKIYVALDFYRSNGNAKIWWIYSVRYIEDDSTEYIFESCKRKSYEQAALAGIEYVIECVLNQ